MSPTPDRFDELGDAVVLDDARAMDRGGADVEQDGGLLV